MKNSDANASRPYARESSEVRRGRSGLTGNPIVGSGAHYRRILDQTGFIPLELGHRMYVALGEPLEQLNKNQRGSVSIVMRAVAIL